jgi:uncharacterized protein YbjT (DUF2867 family)
MILAKIGTAIHHAAKGISAMTRILVTGGRGGLAGELTPRLFNAGYTVRVMSRAERKPDHFPDVEWRQADLETQTGLAEAVEGVDIIVNAASSPAGNPYQVDVAGARTLLEQAQAAGVSHVIHVSIVGIDRMQAYPYYAHKLDAERVIRESGIPYTSARITQFHDFIDRRCFATDTAGKGIALPTDYLFQTIDTGETAQWLVEAAALNSANQLLEIGGPEVLSLGEMARIWTAAQGCDYRIIHQPSTDIIADGRRAGYSTCPDQRYGSITWTQWVQRKYGSPTQKQATT